MVLLNDYFHSDIKANKGSISVTGKLEAYVGNYYVFELIDDGVEYLNPDHFSVNEMIMYIGR